MKEWYLIGNDTKPNMLGGYENQSFLDYKDDAFSEVLGTDIATTVLLCNSDLTEQKEIRCVMEGNTADTQLQSLQRKGLFVPGTVKDGMYIFFQNGYWLIDGYPGTNGIYEKVTMTLCQFKLRWQNAEGKIIQRWVCTNDFTKYSNGVTGNYTVIIGDNQYGLTVPIDEETKKLRRDMRFVIDLDDMDEPDVYKLTNRKTKLNDNQYMGRGGTMILTMSLNAFDNSVDKRVDLHNGEKVWICNYRDSSSSLSSSPSDETTILSKLEIKCPNLEIKPTGYPKKITAALYEVDTGLEVKTANYEWIVDTKISDYISYTADNDILKISLSKQYDECDDEIIITCTDTKTKQSNSIILTTKGVF